MKISGSLQQIRPSYIREILSTASAPDIISLAGGLPNNETFPLSLMESSLLSLPNRRELFQYGNTQGYGPLLEFIKPYYQLHSEHEALICTGSQQGLDLIARAFIEPSQHIVLEAPSYLGALQVFGLAQAKISSVQQQVHGPDLTELEALFGKHDITLFYAVPDFHNPTGVSWSLAIRKKVAALCIQYKVTLIEDVPYRELWFNQPPLPLVSSFCPEHALVLRSFSKTVAPGIRIGLVSGPKKWITPLIKVKQAADLHSSVPMQAVLLCLLQDNHFEEHLNTVRQLYKKGYQHLSYAIQKHLPSTCTFNSVEGGMFLWLETANLDADELARRSLSQGVAVVPSSVFYPQNENTQSALRLNFTHANSSQLDTAMQRLAAVIIQCD